MSHSGLFCQNLSLARIFLTVTVQFYTNLFADVLNSPVRSDLELVSQLTQLENELIFIWNWLAHKSIPRYF